MRDSAAVREVVSRFPAAGDAGVALAAWGAGVFARDLATARVAVEALTAPHRSPEARWYGYALLAHLDRAEGKPADADVHLDHLAELNAGMATETRAALALLPFDVAPRSELVRLRSELEQLDPATVGTSDNPSIIFTANDQLHQEYRAYLLGLLSAQLGDPEAVDRYASQLESTEPRPTDGSLPQDLALSVRAESLRMEGRLSDALATLERAKLATWYAQTSSSILFSQVRERFVRADLLAALGREEEARRYYETMGQLSVFDLAYSMGSQQRLAAMDDAVIDGDAAP